MQNNRSHKNGFVHQLNSESEFDQRICILSSLFHISLESELNDKKLPTYRYTHLVTYSTVLVVTTNLFEKPMKQKDSEQKNHEDATRFSSSRSSSLIQCIIVPFATTIFHQPYSNILRCAAADFTYTAKNTTKTPT